MIESAEIVRRYGPASRGKAPTVCSPAIFAAMAALAQCRTEALGGHLSQCPLCGGLGSQVPFL